MSKIFRKTSNFISIALMSVFTLISCSEEEETILYDFPALSQGQLIDLKKISEKIEGFFISTDLSDLDPSWSERGFYLYICIRFLNDSSLNQKLNQSAVPLLVQASRHKDRPEAETVVLLHPKTISAGGGGVFYDEERDKFKLARTTMEIKGIPYYPLDIEFNSNFKVTNLSFIKSGVSLQELKELLQEAEEEDDEEVVQTENTSASGEEEQPVEDEAEEPTEEEIEEQKRKELRKTAFLNVTSFAKQFSSSCDDWSRINYVHSATVPDYLQNAYSFGADKATSAQEGTEGNAQNNTESSSSVAPGPSSSDSSVIPLQDSLPEDSPHEKVN